MVSSETSVVKELTYSYISKLVPSCSIHVAYLYFLAYCLLLLCYGDLGVFQLVLGRHRRIYRPFFALLKETTKKCKDY